MFTNENSMKLSLSDVEIYRYVRNMKKMIIRDICELLGFDEESILCLEEAWDKINASAEALKCLQLAQREMFDGDVSFKNRLPVISEESAVNRYTSDMVFWLSCAEPLREIYKKEGLPDELCIDCLRDLVYKNRECLKVHGVVGTYVQWFQQFFTLERFAFGRLEYDIKVWTTDDYKDYLSEGDCVFACHIPSSGPLLPEAVLDSLKRLYNFAERRDMLKNGMLAVSCTTWLIYPPMVELLGEESNIRKFHDMFDVIGVNHRKENPYSCLEWIFYKPYSGRDSIKLMPEDTKLQKILKKFYLAGGTQGVGTGIIIFDGEKIINK